MANVQHAGLAPSRRTGGGELSYQRRRVLTNNTLQIALNDVVIIDANGNTLTMSTGTTAGDNVACGASYVTTAGERVFAKNLPAATLYTSSGVDPWNASYVFVTEGPVDVVFRASVDEAIAVTDLNLNYAVTSLTSPSNGISGMELDATGRAVTATIPVRVFDFVHNDPQVDVDAADAHVWCKLNLSLSEPALSAGLGT